MNSFKNSSTPKVGTHEEEEEEVIFWVEYEDGIFMPMNRTKYKNFQKRDEEFLLSISEYGKGIKKRCVKVIIIILASGQLSFSFLEPINAIEDKAYASIEKVLDEKNNTPKQKAMLNNAIDAADPGDDDSNDDEDVNIFIVVIGFLGVVGYKCYEQEINDFCSKVFSNFTEFFGREKIYEPQVISTPDGLNFVNLNKWDVKKIMLELPVLIYRAQKERIHQAVFKTFNLTKPIHLVAEEIKKHALEKINELAINPILQEKMRKYVSDVIQMITANNRSERLEYMKKAINGFEDVFGNLRTAPDTELKKIAPTKIAKSINVKKLYDEIIGKHTPKSDE